MEQNSDSILISDLSKHYENVVSLDNLNLTINRNELFGFIGPDGAGKTSLFRIMATLLFPTKGKVTIFGKDVVDDFRILRNDIGYMPGRFSLYQDLTVEENLNFYATVFGTTIQENYHLIKDIYSLLEPFKNRRAGKLSGGMKQKLALSCALIHKPELLILDEPTTGVDAVSRKEFWEMLVRLKDAGITIVVSTPYMDEASLCDRVALMQDGKLLQVDTPEGVVSKYPYQLFALESPDMHKLLTDLRSKYKGTDTLSFLFGQDIHFSHDGSITTKSLKTDLEAMGNTGIKIAVTQPSIEDCFMALIKNNE
jgi:ABC-type multidrug transport system ATPase subunit